MKFYQIGLIFALILGIADVATATTLPQSWRTKSSQQLPQVPFSEDELFNASPFDPAVQERTFYAVAEIMHIKHLDPKLAMPTVIVNTTIPAEKISEYTGFDFGSNEIHYFSYLKNAILISDDAKVHNLAHEMAHYFQFYYRLKGNPKNLVNDPEPEAIRIQYLFRADNRTFAARNSFYTNRQN
ncbi:MAG: hypothetical protein JSW26_23520 [Desulfobacterales bacterium]|nr:MAG: hypothetical protein JSW26_23520 [Desulfobacterales bacterium]